MGKCECGCGRRTAYSGTYCSGHAPAGTSHDPHGKIKASNARSNPNNNPINNPINNAKVQKRAFDEAMARINEFSKEEDTLTLEEATKEAADIMGHVGDGWNTHGADVEEFLGIDGSERRDNWSHSVYVGYTACAIADEALRWLTPRGAARADADGEYTINPGKLNRPVLLWSDGTTITMGKAQSELGFIFQEVYAAALPAPRPRAPSVALRRHGLQVRHGGRQQSAQGLHHLLAAHLRDARRRQDQGQQDQVKNPRGSDTPSRRGCRGRVSAVCVCACVCVRARACVCVCVRLLCDIR